MTSNEGWRCKRDPFYWKGEVAKAAKELMQNISEHMRDKRYNDFFRGDNQQKINNLFIDITEALGALRTWTLEQSDHIVDLLGALDRIWGRYWA